jgi:hypothetical protein
MKRRAFITLLGGGPHGHSRRAHSSRRFETAEWRLAEMRRAGLQQNAIIAVTAPRLSDDRIASSEPETWEDTMKQHYSEKYSG